MKHEVKKHLINSRKLHVKERYRESPLAKICLCFRFGFQVCFVETKLASTDTPVQASTIPSYNLIRFSMT